MTDDKAKEGELEEGDEDAEAAYRKVRNQVELLEPCDDNEFDYDENVFNSSTVEPKACEKDAELEPDGSVGVPIVFLDKVHVEGDKNANPDAEIAPKKTCYEPEFPSEVVSVPTIGFGPTVRQDIGEDVIAEWEEDRLVATEEWSRVDVVTAVEATASTELVATRSPVTFHEATEHFSSLDLSEDRSKIRPCIERTGLSKLCYTFVGPPPLSKTLIPQRDLIFTLAMMKFDNNNDVCNRVLCTVFKGLTRSKVDCPRYGKHWEIIGFQGNDPSTDLRGCGMLGLLTLLHFIESKRTSTLAANIYHLSQDETQNFPFSVMSINVTRIAMQVLREGNLNKECNKLLKSMSKTSTYHMEDGLANSVLYDIFQRMYVAIFHRIYSIWKNEYKTMADSGYVMKDVETLALKKPLELLHNPFPEPAAKPVQMDDDDKMGSFIGVDELS